MADNFNVDFSLLGALPSVAGAARDRATLKETLADLKSTDPDSLERKASQLLAAGQMEAGLKLQAAALARRQLTQKGAADALQADFLSKFVYPKMGGGGAAPTEQAPNIPLTPAPQTPAPDPFQGPPGAIPGVKPQSALPPTGPQQAAAEPGPSDAIIAAAQQGAAQPQPQQLAGPPPTPNTLPGQTPVMSAETLNAAAAPALGAAPPQAAPQPATDPNTPIKMPAYQADAQAEAAAVGQALSGMPRQLMTSGPGRALMERFRDAMGKLKLDKEQQSWMEERISRRQAGKPDISFGDYKLELQQAPKRIEEAEKIYLDTEKRAGQSQQLISTLDRMSALTKDKDFVSGASANKYAAAVNETLSVLKILGVDPTQFKNRFGTFAKSAQQSAMLNEEFTSLSNQALMAHVGSFSKSFSDADRSFVEKIFPQILQTPGGIEKIIGHLREMAVYDRNASKVSRDYMKNNPLRATSWGVNEALSDYADKNPLFVDSTTGQPTKKGQEILDIAGGNQATTAPDTAAPAAAPAAARKITAEDEGKIFDVGGKLFIIRNGKREPYS